MFHAENSVPDLAPGGLLAVLHPGKGSGVYSTMHLVLGQVFKTEHHWLNPWI